MPVGDLERLRRIGNREIAGGANLLVAALRGAPQPFELEVDEAKVVGACGDVRGEPVNDVSARRPSIA